MKRDIKKKRQKAKKIESEKEGKPRRQKEQNRKIYEEKRQKNILKVKR